MKKLIPIAAGAALLLVGLVAVSYPITAVESGMAKGVDPQASAEDDGGAVRTLRVGDDVAIGETIETGPTGQVQLLFDDETELVVGPRSRLRLDDYLLRNDGSVSKFAVAALAGTFRFVTGNSAHSAYKITTPTGTIGVRGTAFDFAVFQALLAGLSAGPNQWVTSVLLFNGALELCSLSGVCAIINSVCGLGAETEIDAVLIDNTRQTRATYRGYFPYALDQSPLLRPFWVANARTCIAPPPNTSGPPGPLTSGPGETSPSTTTQPTTTTPTTTTTTTTTIP